MKRNIIANFIGRFWSVLSNFIFIPLYIHYLGFESYSIISFTLIIAGLMAILDGGLTATLSREFARMDKTHLEKIRMFTTLETCYYLIVAGAIIIVISLSGIIADKWLNLKSFNPQEVSYFLKIISFDIGFQLLLRFYLGGLLGLEKQVRANFYQVGWGALRNGLVVLGLLISPTLEVFFVWQAIATAIFTVLIRLALNKTLIGDYKVNFRFKIEKAEFKNIRKFAVGMLLISLVAGLNTQMDKIAISRLLPVESLGYYTLAISLAMGIIIVVNPISVSLLPRFTALYSIGKDLDATKLFQKINLIIAILVFSIVANMAFSSKELIWIWTNNMELAEKAYVYLPILAFSIALLSLSMLPYDIAIANGYTKLNNILGLCSLLITIPGYWFATSIYGGIGAAFIFCIVQTSFTLIYFYFINKKFLKIKSIGSNIYIKQILFPMLISFILAFGFSYISDWTKDNRFISFVWIGASTIFTMVMLTLILLPRKDVRTAISYIINLKKSYI